MADAPKVQKGGKHKMQRPHKKKGYYEQQLFRTIKNKLRRASARNRRRSRWGKPPI